MTARLAAKALRVLLGGSVAAALAVALLALAASPATAHEKRLPAKTLVAQAIALLRTQPGQVAAIEDKIHDALEAKDTAGVDLALVRQADTAFDRGDRHRAWDLLEAAIGAAPHRVVTQPNPKPRQPATTQPPSSGMAMPSPTTTGEAEGGVGSEAAPHEQALAGGQQRPAGTGAATLLGVAGVLALAGAVVVRRVHR